MTKALKVNATVTWNNFGAVCCGTVQEFLLVKNGLGQKCLAMIVRCSGAMSSKGKQVVLINKEIDLTVV
jgi:hypothetical protein